MRGREGGDLLEEEAPCRCDVGRARVGAESMKEMS